MAEGKHWPGTPPQSPLWLEAGGRLLAIGLDQQEANAFLPMKVATESEEHIASYFEPFGVASLLSGVSPADVHNAAPRTLPLLSGAAAIGDGVLGKTKGAHVVFCQLPAYDVGMSPDAPHNVKRTYRRTSFLLTRLLANMGIASTTPLLDRFAAPLEALAGMNTEGRWREGLYLDEPEEWDDPYRFFRW